MQHSNCQDLSRSFWSFSYAEQAASSDYQRLLNSLSDKSTYNLDAAKEAIDKLSGWSQTLRPGQCDALKELVDSSVKAWVQEWIDIIDAEPKDADPENENPEDGDKPGPGTIAAKKNACLPIGRLLPLAKSLPVEESAVTKLEKHSQQEQTALVQQKLDASVKGLCGEEPKCEEFLNACRVSTGVSMSQKVSEDPLTKSFC